jgi:hypothetical protein
VIKGKQALAFVRQRHGLPNGDLDRIKRQQYFLSSAFRKVTSAGVLLNPFKLHDLLTAVGSSLLIDPKLDLLSLAREFQQMSAGKITFRTIPNNGPQVIYPDGVQTAIVEVNTAAMPSFLRELEGKVGDAALAAATAAPRSSVTVDVLNGTTIPLLASRNSDQLRSLGFKVNAHDSTNATESTTIEYAAGMEAQAKAVASVVRGAKLIETATVSRVTLVLGANGVQVTGLSSTAGTTSAAATASKAPANPVQTSTAAGGLGCIN